MRPFFVPRRRQATSASPEPTRLPSARDLVEQQERINNLRADTALKLETIRIAKFQLFIAIVAVAVSIGGAIIGALTLFFDHRAPPPSRTTIIFLSPGRSTVL